MAICFMIIYLLRHRNENNKISMLKKLELMIDGKNEIIGCDFNE